MVNHGDVRALLVRLNDELQVSANGPTAEEKSTAQNGADGRMSFAAKLSAELDAARTSTSAMTENLSSRVKGTASASVKPVTVKPVAGEMEAADPASDGQGLSEQISSSQKQMLTPEATNGDVVRPRISLRQSDELPLQAVQLAGEGDTKEDSAVKAKNFAGTTVNVKPANKHAEKDVADAKGSSDGVQMSAMMQAPDAATATVVATAAIVPQSVSFAAKQSADGTDVEQPRGGLVARKDIGGMRPMSPGVVKAADGKEKDGLAAAQAGVSGVDENKDEAVQKTDKRVDASAFQEQIQGAVVADHSAAGTMSVDAATAMRSDMHAAGSSTVATNHVASANSIDVAQRGQLELRESELPIPDRTIVATPGTLEVGIANGSHGWLKIRAELTDAGTVTASLSSNTSAGTQTLHHDLPALSSFLDREQVSVTNLVVHQADSSGFFAGADSGNGRAGGQQQQEGHAGQGERKSSFDVEVPAGLEGLLEVQSGDGLSAGGGWLSVRA